MRWAAGLWLAAVLLVIGHQVSFWRAGQLDTDVLALLPRSEQSPGVLQAAQVLSDSAQRQIVVLLGSPDEQSAQRAARVFAAEWRAGDAALAPAAPGASPAQAVQALQPWRDRLLTPAQRLRLERASTAELVQSALTALHQPGGSGRLSDWLSDPLSLWSSWWSARTGASPVRPQDGWLMFEADGLHWVVLSGETRGSAFSLHDGAMHGDAIRAAEAAARVETPGLKVLAAGVPLHAEAAAAQASREVNLIGLGSLGAIVLLVWCAFRSVRPIALVALTLVVGCMTALSVTVLVFGKVHLLTLVFGASLVGVAEDYGIHYFASRQRQPGVAPFELIRGLMPALLLALCTSVIAYLVLGLAPFPGLRQMAVFSATGLTAAFLTAACWVPWLDRGRVAPSRFAAAVGGSLERWPLLRGRGWWALAVAVLFSFVGVARLAANDDIRQLQSSPQVLVDSQREVGRLLRLPSPAQFFLVQGASEQQVLEREEALKAVLDRLPAGTLAGYQAVSDWVPSIARQQADALLTARVEAQVLAGVGSVLGEQLERPAFAPDPLTLQRWLDRPEATATRALWLGVGTEGYSSMVLLHGLDGRAAAQLMQTATATLPGVRWIDRTAEVSGLMARYRISMSVLLAVGFVLVLGLLWHRHGRTAWRAWLPTLLACLFSVGMLGWIGEGFQLFNVLALVLLLGIGVDYGIFLLESHDDGSAWLAIVLGAASTLLSFGLLGLSNTPALRAFGLTMLFGVAFVWFLSPLFRPHADHG
ncbi:MMPL family transporter [Schlegelella sp. S2-27]|uniref:MMPL family transporter n=1 Tax=Caldimonas mangrovi TaxID=2944811 RepID=A0ABT0YVA6_9BURK|nr:MMPL family transporter [Caldimonas mangrovi]MCM5682689.1 MMPL family transporter [Caldimonas mangrovi]